MIPRQMAGTPVLAEAGVSRTDGVPLIRTPGECRLRPTVLATTITTPVDTTEARAVMVIGPTTISAA